MVGAVQHLHGQFALQVLGDGTAERDSDVVLVSFVEELRLHETDLDRDGDHHLTADGLVTQGLIVRKQLHVVGGEFVRIGETETDVAILVAAEERLPGDGIREVLSYGDVGGGLRFLFCHLEWNGFICFRNRRISQYHIACRFAHGHLGSKAPYVNDIGIGCVDAVGSAIRNI